MPEGEEASIKVALIAQGPSRQVWRPLIETSIAALVVALILYVMAYNPPPKEYQTNSILIAILPVLFWLFFSGRITGFKAFGVELKAAIEQASRESIRAGDAFRSIEFDPIAASDKERADRIPEYKARRVAVLAFELGLKDYYMPETMKLYLDELTLNGSLKWVVFRQKSGRFEGIIPVQELRNYGGLSLDGRSGYDRIKDMIENHEVNKLAGFIGRGLALKTSDTTGTAIERFSQLDIDDLPVVDSVERFAGMVHRGKLMSSLFSTILRSAQSAS